MLIRWLEVFWYKKLQRYINIYVSGPLKILWISFCGKRVETEEIFVYFSKEILVYFSVLLIPNQSYFWFDLKYFPCF